jgi:hypothetical protein
MTAQEALDGHFIDHITETLELAAYFDLSKFKYRKAPERAAAPSDRRSKLARMSLMTQRIRIASNPK